MSRETKKGKQRDLAAHPAPGSAPPALSSPLRADHNSQDAARAVTPDGGGTRPMGGRAGSGRGGAERPVAAAERRREGRARGSTAAAGTMPVHSREKKENNHDEMEVDYGENEGSSSEEEETESSSVSEEGDSSGTAAARKAAPLRGRRGGSLSARCCPGFRPGSGGCRCPLPFPSRRDPAPAQPVPLLGGSARLGSGRGGAHGQGAPLSPGPPALEQPGTGQGRLGRAAPLRARAVPCCD